MKALGVDFGQGFYFGQPTERPMASTRGSSARGPTCARPSGLALGGPVAERGVRTV